MLFCRTLDLYFVLCRLLLTYAICAILFAGVGFLTSIIFIFLVGVFVSSWIGSSVLWMGEWFIKRMPLVKHIYSASKQISAAISPGKVELALFPARDGDSSNL